MSALAHQRCTLHAGREAVARCPLCGHYYCRECVTEHEGRVICAQCLREISRTKNERRRRWMGGFLRVGQWILGLWLGWLFFYGVGQMLLKIPDSFHDAEYLEVEFLDEEP